MVDNLSGEVLDTYLRSHEAEKLKEPSSRLLRGLLRLPAHLSLGL